MWKSCWPLEGWWGEKNRWRGFSIAETHVGLLPLSPRKHV